MRSNYHITFRETTIRIRADFSSETMEAGRNWIDILMHHKGGKHQSKIPYFAKTSFRIESEIKIFSDEQNLRQFVTSTCALQEITKGISGKRELFQMEALIFRKEGRAPEIYNAIFNLK